MGKKQRERKQRKEAQRAVGRKAPPYLNPLFGQEASPPARALVEKIARQPNLNEERLIRVFADSEQLRKEPEFRDLYFNLVQTDQVAARLLPQHLPLIQAAAKVNQDEVQQRYDDFGLRSLMNSRRANFAVIFCSAMIECSRD